VQIHEEADPLQAKNLFNLEGKRWKDMRSKLVPTFTSGKLKNMLPLMQEVAAEFDTKLKELTENKEEFEIRVIYQQSISIFINIQLKLRRDYRKLWPASLPTLLELVFLASSVTQLRTRMRNSGKCLAP
jgi:cytochrome P450